MPRALVTLLLVIASSPAWGEGRAARRVDVLLEPPGTAKQPPGRARVADLAATDAARVQRAAGTITGADILKHVRALSADRFEGRGPGTPGEDSTVAYLTRELHRIGLEPGN